jgi:CheY-specific phosphatase CheX
MKEVFSTMLSMELKDAEAPGTDLEKGLPRIVGSVSFAGKAMGCVNVHVPAGFAREITANMLGMELEEIEGEDEVGDVIGEIGNMIGGYLKSRFCDSGLPCELSIPSVASGTDFRMEATNWDIHESFSFRKSANSVMAEVFLKSIK